MTLGLNKHRVNNRTGSAEIHRVQGAVCSVGEQLQRRVLADLGAAARVVRGQRGADRSHGH